MTQAEWANLGESARDVNNLVASGVHAFEFGVNALARLRTHASLEIRAESLGRIAVAVAKPGKTLAILVESDEQRARVMQSIRRMVARLSGNITQANDRKITFDDRHVTLHLSHIDHLRGLSCDMLMTDNVAMPPPSILEPLMGRIPAFGFDII